MFDNGFYVKFLTILLVCLYEFSCAAQLKIDYTSYSSSNKNFRERFLILHYTAGNFGNSVSELTGDSADSRSVSSHYIVPTLKGIDPTYPNDELIVYSIVPEMDRAWDVGVSAWRNRTDLNDSSIGVEIVNLTNDTKFEPFPEQQINVIIELCKNIVSRYPDIIPTNILGHGDVAVGRKEDPGPLFPWEKLYKAGIGAWYDQELVNRYKDKFEKNMPSDKDVLNKLYQYGYVYSGEPYILFRAFQMHFRPTNYSGTLDAETAAIAYALVDKYR